MLLANIVRRICESALMFGRRRRFGIGLVAAIERRRWTSTDELAKPCAHECELHIMRTSFCFRKTRVKAKAYVAILMKRFNEAAHKIVGSTFPIIQQFDALFLQRFHLILYLIALCLKTDDQQILIRKWIKSSVHNQRTAKNPTLSSLAE